MCPKAQYMELVLSDGARFELNTALLSKSESQSTWQPSSVAPTESDARSQLAAMQTAQNPTATTKMIQ